MKIYFTTRAKSDMAEIVEYISQDNPQAAKKWANAIFDSVNGLDDFPEIGRIVPEYAEDTIREIIIGQYRIVYKINQPQKEIYIITVHHSRRRMF
jgi:toxin ParE1/3/4